MIFCQAVTPSPARAQLKNSQLTPRPRGERYAYLGDRTLGYAPSASVLIALFLLVAAPGSVRADHVLVADGPGQNLKSVAQIYSTSTAQPAILAIRGGTILSIRDLVTILPPGGLTGLQAQGIGSQITAQDLTIAGLGLGQSGISGARGADGGSVTLDGGKIEIAGDSSFGLFGDN